MKKYVGEKILAEKFRSLNVLITLRVMNELSKAHAFGSSVITRKRDEYKNSKRLRGSASRFGIVGGFIFGRQSLRICIPMRSLGTRT